MGRRTVTPFANQIKRVLPPKHVIDLRRRGAFCHRERLFTPHRLMRSLLAGHAMGRVETLADIHRQFHALFGATTDNSMRCSASRWRTGRFTTSFRPGTSARDRPRWQVERLFEDWNSCANLHAFDTGNAGIKDDSSPDWSLSCELKYLLRCR